MHRGYLLLCLVVLTLLPSVAALDLSVVHEPARADVFVGESATYTVFLHNDAHSGDPLSVQLKSLDLNWILQEDFVTIDIAPRATETVVIHYDPLEDLTPGDYGIQLVASADGGRKELFLPVRVLDTEDVFLVDFYSDAPVDPRQSAILKVSLRNVADRDFSHLAVEVHSEFFDFSSTGAVAPLGDAILEFPVQLPEHAGEGEYPVTVTVFDGDMLLGTYADVLAVSEYGDLTEVVVDSSSFLRTSTSVTQTNEGNAVYSAPFVREFSLVEKMFTTFSPTPSSVAKQNGYYAVTWDVSLLAGETITISYVTSYRLAVGVVLLLMVLGFAWYYFSRRTVTVAKKVVSVQPKKGKLSTLKVTLVVNNTSSRNLKNVKLLDRVPNTKVAPQRYGTLKPKVKKGVKSVSLLWEIPTLRAGEERVITYEVKSSLHFSGSLLLPAAVARYRDGSRREMSVSNTCTIREK